MLPLCLGLCDSDLLPVCQSLCVVRCSYVLAIFVGVSSDARILESGLVSLSVHVCIYVCPCMPLCLAPCVLSLAPWLKRPSNCHLRASLRVISCRISFWHWSRSLLDMSPMEIWCVFVAEEPRSASQACRTSCNTSLPYFKCTM